MSDRKQQAIICGVDLLGINLGIKRNIIRKVAKSEELIKARAVRIKIDETRRARNATRHPEMLQGLWAIEHAAKRELAGYRTLWRCRYCNTMGHGVYRITRNLQSYQWKSPVGDFGLGQNNYYSERRLIEKGTICIWAGRDELGQNEFMISSQGIMLKIAYGKTDCDSFEQIEDSQ